jgi:pSer/pThr/pTyr-binding forkhead associated (FHA) protein
MAVRLVPLGDGPPISLDRPIVFVGRHVDCDIRIDSKKISRRHCCIIQLQDRLVIRDLGSTNGIYCNGQRVEEAVLTPQDEVQIANFRYRVIVNDAGPDSPLAGSAGPPTVPPEQGGGIPEDQVRRPPADPPEANQLS